jgi:hypothetical protein
VGAGSVSASATGDPDAGIYLPEGTPVTLTASIPAGFVFVGWRGDTAATAPSIALVMNKAYDLEARFAAAVSVAPSDAVGDLLGNPRLTTAQKVFLDELGNRNGLYDVGDYLALLRRGIQAAPPTITRAARGVTGEAKEERP